MSDETNAAAEPRWEVGIPWCQEKCAQHDGKRCRLMGFRPDTVCEPTVREVVEERDALRAQLADAETGVALLRVAREERDEAEAECTRLRESLDAVRRERDALRAEVADLLPMLDAQAFAGGVAQREIETLRAQLAAAEERTARAWGLANAGAVKCIHAAVEFWQKAAEEREAWRDDLHRFAGSLRGLEREVASLTPPESPDA